MATTSLPQNPGPARMPSATGRFCTTLTLTPFNSGQLDNFQHCESSNRLFDFVEYLCLWEFSCDGAGIIVKLHILELVNGNSNSAEHHVQSILKLNLKIGLDIALRLFAGSVEIGYIERSKWQRTEPHGETQSREFEIPFYCLIHCTKFQNPASADQ